MKFTKLTIAVLLLALLVSAFAACGGDTGETGNESGDDAVETVPTPETDENGEHVHTIVEKIDEPTCTDKGYKREVCATCDEQISVKPIAQVDHVAAAPATCTAGSVCKFCGMVMESATGHKVDTYTETKPSTNTEPGYNKGTCSVCGEEVTEVIPAGVSDNYNKFPVGALTTEVLSANSTFGSDFTYEVKGEAYEIVSEGNNNYIKKTGVDGQIFYKSESLNAKKLVVSFDFRLDQECKSIKGLFSWINGKEMRVLNIKDNAIQFGINNGGVIRIQEVEVGKWVNFKVVLDTNTYDYELYIDGVLSLATASDPDNAGMHLIYTLKDGEMVQKVDGFSNETIHNGADRSPFVPNGDGINQFYFCHWSKDFACSLDNLVVSMVND